MIASDTAGRVLAGGMTIAAATSAAKPKEEPRR